jgi:hypothetical protein
MRSVAPRSASRSHCERIAVIDFRLDSPEGPPKAARIAPDRVVAELKAAGYSLAREHRFLPNQHFLIFTPL